MPSRIRANGIEMSYCLEGPAEQPVVIFSNGLASDMASWAFQLAALDGGFRVLRYDTRGHGASSAPPGDYSLRLLAEDLVALMDGLDIGAAHLIGTSLGGMTAQFLAARYPERVLSLVLSATSCDVSRDAWRDRIDRVRGLGVRSVAAMTVDLWFTPSFRSENARLVAFMKDMVARIPLDGYLGCAAAIRDMDLVPNLAAISAPTLVLAGEEDRSTPPRDLARIAEGIPGARLVPIAGAAHLPTFERPEECNAAIEEFLSSVSRGLSSIERAVGAVGNFSERG